MSAKVVIIKTNNGNYEQPVIRSFCFLSECVVLTGEDFSDHALWVLDELDKCAYLIGTLAEEDYRKIRRAKKLDIDCNSPAFAYIEPRYACRHLTGSLGIADTETPYSDKTDLNTIP